MIKGGTVHTVASTMNGNVTFETKSFVSSPNPTTIREMAMVPAVATESTFIERFSTFTSEDPPRGWDWDRNSQYVGYDSNPNAGWLQIINGAKATYSEPSGSDVGAFAALSGAFTVVEGNMTITLVKSDGTHILIEVIPYGPYGNSGKLSACGKEIATNFKMNQQVALSVASAASNSSSFHVQVDNEHYDVAKDCGKGIETVRKVEFTVDGEGEHQLKVHSFAISYNKPLIVEEAKSDSSTSTRLVIGAAIGGTLLLILIAACARYCAKNRKGGADMPATFNNPAYKQNGEMALLL